MALPFPSALSRRDRLWPAVTVSLAAHAALVVWLALRAPPVPLDLEKKAIVARLVRLGPKRPEQYLPQRDTAPPAAAAPAPAPAPSPRPAAPPARAQPAPASPARAPAAGTPSGGTSLASILSRVEREAARDRERWGDPDGDPAGEAEAGSEGDRYLGLVVQQLKRNYEVPKTIQPQDLALLKATVVLRIDASGRISSHDFERRSGNASYDAALVRAISRTQLPPPPPELRAHYARVGLGVNFHL